MTDFAPIQSALDAGGLVLLPTETVYGLAARADMPSAIDKIYTAKGRDFDKPLAVCIRDLYQADFFGEFDDVSRALAERYWPGPVTIVMDADPGTGLDPRVRAGRKDAPTIALRCPDVPWRTELTMPLALTSANLSGQADCTDYTAAMDMLGRFIDASWDGTLQASGKPSTIIQVRAGQISILRQGSTIIEGVWS